MANLYLHVGHGKTGSSYMQSSLALSYSKLSNFGYEYPESSSSINAKSGKITSGNGSLFKEYHHDGADKNIIFSSEVFFQDVIKGRMDSLLYGATGKKYESINILLLIRNPVDHASSSFQQRIKRGGSTVAVEEMFASYEQPRLVRDFIDKVALSKWATLKVHNYSIKKDNLLGILEDWLGLPEETLEKPDVKNVNRSMTYGELRFQTAVNRILGPSSGLVSDKLCNKLPNIKADKILPSASVQDEMLNRLADDIEYVNSHVSPESRYQSAVEETVEVSDSYSFTGSQIDVLATSMASTILRLRRQLAELTTAEKSKGNKASRSVNESSDVLVEAYRGSVKGMRESWNNVVLSARYSSISIERILHLLEGAYKNKSGFSVVRSGDGEGCFLYRSIENYNDDLYRYCVKGTLNLHFGPQGYTEKDYEFWESRLKVAFEYSDVITSARSQGVVDSLLDKNSPTDLRASVGQIAGSIVPWEIAKRRNSHIYENGYLHRDLIPYYSSLLKGKDVVLLGSTCKEISVPMEKGFGCKVVHSIVIPGQHSVIRRRLKVPLYPEMYDAVLEELQSIDLRGKLVLIGAGLAGKVFCLEAARHGGVALDVGSMMDAWAGIKARHYHSEDMLSSVSLV